MRWFVPLLLFLIGCNSETPSLSAIQGMRDPNNPLAYITHVSLPDDGVYTPLSPPTFDITFSEPVDVSGFPEIGIQTESGLVFAVYSGRVDESTLSFTYNVAAGDLDADGIGFSNPLIITGGSVYTPEDNDPALTTYVAPANGVLLNGRDSSFVHVTRPQAKTYKAGDELFVTLNFDYPVFVQPGVPYLELDIGSNLVSAYYFDGSGGTSLRFRYIVGSGLSDVDGVRLTAGHNLNAITDEFLDPVAITLSAQTFTGALVDSLAPTIASVTPPLNKTYYPNEVLRFTVTFSESVSITGTPRLPVKIGTPIKYATMVADPGPSQTYHFEYVVQVGDYDIGGISIDPLSLDPNGAAIQDTAGNLLSDTSLTVPDLSGVKVDGVAPTIGYFSVYTSGAGEGKLLRFTLNSTSTLYVNTAGGVPRLQLNIGGTTKYADYAGTISTLHVFEYVIEPGLEDTDGITVISPLELRGGTIKDGADPMANDLVTTFAPPDTSTLVVDSVAPTIVSINATAGSYRPTQTLSIELTFSEAVYVDGGVPFLELSLDSGPVQANFVAASSTPTKLVFDLIVTAAEMDLTGLEIASLNLDSGTIKDLNDNNLDLTLPTNELPDVFIIPQQLTYWFDATDRTTLGTSGADLEQFISKADPISTTIFGLPEVTTAGPETKSIKFEDGESIVLDRIPMVHYMFIAYKSPGDASGKSLMMDIGGSYYEGGGEEVTYATIVEDVISNPFAEPEIDVSSTNQQLTYKPASINFNAGGTCYLNGCMWFDSVNWRGTNNDGTLQNFLWANGEYRKLMMNFKGSGMTIKLGHGGFDGEIMEVMIFTAPSLPDSQILTIGEYLSTKHGVFW